MYPKHALTNNLMLLLNYKIVSGSRIYEGIYINKKKKD